MLRGAHWLFGICPSDVTTPNLALQHLEHSLELRRLVEEVVRAQRGAGTSMMLRGIVGQHDDPDFGPLALQILEQLHAIARAKVQVEHHHVRRLFRQELARFSNVRGFQHGLDSTHVGEQRSQTRSNRGSIVDDQNVHS